MLCLLNFTVYLLHVYIVKNVKLFCYVAFHLVLDFCFMFYLLFFHKFRTETTFFILFSEFL